jgi:hypothetical protein
MDDLEELEELIDEHGLSEHRDVILATAMPAVFIYLDERRAGRIGESRIGGIPDLPESLPWPHDPTGARKLCFLMQISLYELPVFDETPFPRRGMLYLFGDQCGGDAGRVMVYTGREPLLPTEPPAGKPFATDAYDDLVPHRIGFQFTPDVPRWATGDFYALCKALGPEHEGEYEYEDALDSLGHALSGGAVGKLLGHASGIGHDPREDAYVVREVNPAWRYDFAKRGTLDMSPVANWHNLLKVHSSDEVNLMFSDSGYLQALVHRNDLERLDFSRVYVDLQSS